MKVSAPKPAHLGPVYGAQFQDRSVAEAYRYRPPYPEETFAILADLILDEPRIVLDAGCGRGEVARPLAGLVERVDTIALSAAMIERGRGLPGGDAPNLDWIVGAVEEVPLRPPYALITAGASLHGMEWDVALPRFREALTPRGVLAIVDQATRPTPWDAALGEIIDRFSTNREYAPYDLIGELELRGLFENLGEGQTEPAPFLQTVEEYVESFHARNGFSRERMGSAQAAAFDAAVRALVAPFAATGTIELRIEGTVVWGWPGPMAEGHAARATHAEPQDSGAVPLRRGNR